MTAWGVYRREAGYSFLETVEVALEVPTKRQILNPTEPGKALGGLSPRAVNSVLAAMNFQTKITNGKWEPIGMGTAYAVMLDTGKLHSDGTPIRQLKWDTGVIPVIQNFLDAESKIDILPLKGDFTMHLTNKGPHTRAFVLSIILKIFNRFDKYSYG